MRLTIQTDGRGEGNGKAKEAGEEANQQAQETRGAQDPKDTQDQQGSTQQGRPGSRAPAALSATEADRARSWSGARSGFGAIRTKKTRP
jgi:hypothetical protein